MERFLLMLLVPVAAVSAAAAAELRFKERALSDLARHVPEILKTYDAKTGRFGTGIWICNDQQQMYPLAAAYAASAPGNVHHKDPKLLEAIMKAGDALIEDMDEQGRWVFRKKDGSTWGKIHMPWTYSRWLRTFGLIRDAMPAERRERWTKALSLGYGKIAEGALRHVHNIPAHHAMGLYAAGKALGRPEWCQQAAKFLEQVAARQTEGGYWAEGGGPVVVYGFVYVDALGTYYAMSGDRKVLPALERAAAFHRHFTYPNGHNVETVDQRNPYHAQVSPGNVGFSFTPVGRAHLKAQWSQLGGPLDADLAASLVLYGEEGPLAEEPSGRGEEVFVLRERGVERAATLRRGPWFICWSAYTARVVNSRWIQDRQNLVSIYHEKTGLILGGGNTKLQPAWSSFAVGDLAALAHRPGDTNPSFLPKGTLYHVPSVAKLSTAPEPALELTYGPETCRLRVVPKDERSLEYVVEAAATSGLPIYAHLTLIPQLAGRVHFVAHGGQVRTETAQEPQSGQTLETAAGQKLKLTATPIELSAEQLGGWVSYAGWRLRLPPTASLSWPVFPHNPYRADGRATPEEARIVIRIPLDRQHREQRVVLEVP
ncbi:MAG TPA: hypothetical protein VNE39_05085 [Planctomycetota bacterium]|nr:hypothetical protein [Planctomycetota bacterium]